MENDKFSIIVNDHNEDKCSVTRTLVFYLNEKDNSLSELPFMDWI